MIKDGKIYSNEINKWVDVQELFQEIVNIAADTMEHDATMKFVHCSDADGNRHGYPTIRTFTQHKSDEVCQALLDIGIPAQVDLYEDDDGYYPYRQIWSVTIPTYKVSHEDSNHYVESTNWKYNSAKGEYENVSK